ncbi:MaoC family dehydratase [Streptomyces sp. RK75]|uniref:MaoC family dehydratase n=1 Tax=Streptomyces sp. RK75 TaxID=2824895 RepID=UPI001B367427|nr:MaoC family dehydratase [Streptomyces sp. RK75]MBQ0866687.1 MaoC family dehydratase [Streptomyces sp. RK75]
MAGRHLHRTHTPLRHLAKAAVTAPLKRGPYTGARLPQERISLPPAAVDPERVRRYAQLCGHDPGSEALPPAYPHVMAFPSAVRLLAARHFPFPLPGLVHLRIELTQHRPLRRTDRPRLTVHAEGPAPHRGGTAFDLVTEAALDGERAWHSRSTYLCRHRTARPSAPASPTLAPAPPLAARWRLPSDLGRRYAAVSGDHNPIHLHPLTARPFGFPRALAHGMWTFARCLAELERTAGRASGGIGWAEAEFKTPVLLPAQVDYALDPATGAFALRGGPDSGKPHLTGRAGPAPR